MKSKLLTYAEEYVERINSLLEENNLSYTEPRITYDDFWQEVIIQYSDNFILYVEDIDEVTLMGIDEEFTEFTNEEIVREWKRAVTSAM